MAGWPVTAGAWRARRNCCKKKPSRPTIGAVPKTPYGVSPWIHDFPRSRRPDFPRFRGDLAADVVIIGGGLTGCATAFACAAAGLKPVLVERDRLGASGTARAAGMLLP